MGFLDLFKSKETRGIIIRPLDFEGVVEVSELPYDGKEVSIIDPTKAIDAGTWDQMPKSAQEALKEKGFYPTTRIEI